MEKKYHVIVIYSKIFGNDILKFYEKSRVIELRKFINENFPFAQNMMFFSHQCRIVFLIGEGIDDFNETLDKIIQLLKEFYKQSCFLIGISSLHFIEDLNKAYKESILAVGYLNHNSSTLQIQRYDELGILSLFTDDKGKTNRYFTDNIIAQFIQPLIDYDKQNDTYLMTTLRMYLNNNFSQSKTSELLYIHVNTLRSRLSKIESLLNVKLKSSNDLLNVQLAIKLYEGEIFH
ncbi:PucR family transcriptional regulator [Vagococcus elongatus]|uniref:PucR family transcriptional regulator n=1 Tax=Vagococcus elongatus TaxID=180344 RepID=UPI001476F2E3|nr:helix-turn-helix domain-containing protein [Vagococcus elongatus]